jgi:hypothetical protein
VSAVILDTRENGDGSPSSRGTGASRLQFCVPIKLGDLKSEIGHKPSNIRHRIVALSITVRILGERALALVNAPRVHELLLRFF